MRQGRKLDSVERIAEGAGAVIAGAITYALLSDATTASHVANGILAINPVKVV